MSINVTSTVEKGGTFGSYMRKQMLNYSYFQETQALKKKVQHKSCRNAFTALALLYFNCLSMNVNNLRPMNTVSLNKELNSLTNIHQPIPVWLK
jgi:hypothetical protein